MENPFYRQQGNGRRSGRMEAASFYLGIIAVTTPCLIYTTLICGSLGIVFALLSRGGELTLTPRAKAGLIMGLTGLAILLFMIVYTIAVASLCYGGLEEMLRQMYGQMGLDYDVIFR